MKLCFCVPVVCMIILNFHAIAASKEAKSMKNIEKQDTSEGLTLTAALPEKCFAGERFDLVITIKNQRKDDVVYYESTLARDFNMAVLDSRGKPVPLTEFGKSMLPKDNNIRFGLARNVLSSGKEIRLTTNLARVFDLSIGEGNYTFYLSRELLLNEDNPVKLMRVKLKLEIPFKVSEPPK